MPLQNVNLNSFLHVRSTFHSHSVFHKSQVLTTMLANDKIHPRLAFEHCGMFADPNLAYQQSMEYAKMREESIEQSISEYTKDAVNAEKELNHV